LNVTPVVHSGGKLQLKISQEVSGVASGSPGVGSSPIITTRKVDTNLSATDGQTMLIGGLIREQRDGGNSGVPLAKDLPILGSVFRNSANEAFSRTELVILITAYVIEDELDAQAVTSAFRNQFPWAKQSATGADNRLNNLTIPPRAGASSTLVESSKPSTTLTMPATTASSLLPTATTTIMATATTTTTMSATAVDKTPTSSEVRRPYVLKPQVEPLPAINTTRPADTVAPVTGSAVSPAAGGAAPSTGARAPTTPPNTSRTPSSPNSAAPPAGRVVTDPALLRELREAIQQGNKP
jgi:general secretion pathway protein D